MIPCIMELGGKCPTIVDEGVDMENAVIKIACARFGNSGQTCVSPDYVLCAKSVLEEFKKRIVEKTKEIYGNSPTGTDIQGKMVNEFHTKRM
jgi:aldehyde dehydrogenase (NAD+)